MVTKPIISAIAVIGKNRALGKDNKLLWHLPEDLKRFKKLTHGHAVIMGQRTFESIGSKPLPGRVNIVLSKDIKYNPQNCIVARSIDEALSIAKTKEKDEIFIIGGGQVYEQTLENTDKLYLTIVDDSPEADTYFPVYSAFKKKKKTGGGEYKDLKYEFLELEK